MYCKPTVVWVVSAVLCMADAPPVVYPMDATVNPSTAKLPQTAKEPQAPVQPEPAVLPMNHIVYPINGDSDGDGVPNSKDAFPGNPNEWLDTDHDGIGNNADNDDDGDGISDSVEKAHGMNALNASDAQADWDNDGFSNIIEINAGTNIKNAKSKPTWTPVIMGEIIIFIPAGV